MSYPPPDPNFPAPPTGPAPGYPAPPGPMAPPPHQWPGAAGPGWQGGPPPTGRPGPMFAVAAVLLGLLAVSLPLLPNYVIVDPTNLRPFIGVPFAVAGLVCGIVGCTGHRRAIGLAILGIVLSSLGLLVEFIMIAGRL